MPINGQDKFLNVRHIFQIRKKYSGRNPFSLSRFHATGTLEPLLLRNCLQCTGTAPAFKYGFVEQVALLLLPSTSMALSIMIRPQSCKSCYDPAVMSRMGCQTFQCRPDRPGFVALIECVCQLVQQLHCVVIQCKIQPFHVTSFNGLSSPADSFLSAFSEIG